MSDLIELVSGVTFIVTVVLLLASVLKMTDRLYRHRALGRRAPQLLKRDLLLLGTIAVLILVPSAALVFFNASLSFEPWWVLLRSVLSVTAMGYWAYLEFFVIGSDDEEGELDG